MLFDLRSAGRRRFIKIVYVTLALLMGGGLVLFGIGGDNFDSETSGFTAEGKAKLRQATDAWEKHVEVADKPDDRLAASMAQAYVELDQPAKAAEAQEIITEARPKAGAFAQLAVYAYAAGQTRRGDLARDRALELTDRDQREALEQQLAAARAQAAAAAAQT